MIVLWMLAATVFACAVGVAALAVERLLRATQRSARGVWLAALAVAVVWPVLVPMVRPLVAAPCGETRVWVRDDRCLSGADIGSAPVSRVHDARLAIAEQSDERASIAAQVTAFATRVSAGSVRWFDANAHVLQRAALFLWAAVSLLLLLRLRRAARVVRAQAHSAQSIHVDGAPVLLADALGPACVGWRAPQVVLPSWVLALDAPLRALVLRHEQEHCRARDPRLVWCAAIANALVPWNMGVWWITRRLRLALELDCDARTLQHGGDPVMYAKLLLFMTQQHAAPAAAVRLANALAASRSHLSRRIVAMQQREHRMPRGTRIGLGIVALASVAVACGTTIPGNLVVADSSSRDVPRLVALDSLDDSNVAAGATDVDTMTFTADQLEPAARARRRTPVFDLKYPMMLRMAQVEGTVTTRFVVDRDGRVDMGSLEVTSSDHALFTEAVKRALALAEYVPATENGRTVRQRVEQPFVFALSVISSMASNAKLSRAGHDAQTVMIPGLKVLSDAKSEVALRQPDRYELSRSEAKRDSATYLERQVEKPAAMAPGQTGLKYPEMLRSAQVAGSVVARFVVNERGEVEMSTFEIINSDHELFSHAVRSALEKAKYLPAEVNGVKVRQLVHAPFQFSLAR